MKESFFRTMGWLHTWVGLLTIWLLITVFFAGTLSFFKEEITLWSQPNALKNVPHSILLSQEAQIEHGIEVLKQKAPNASSWYITPATDRKPYFEVAYRDAPQQGKRTPFTSHYYSANDANKEIEFIETKGGSFFYRLHFDLHYMSPITARWIVCFASLFMLIALISGIIIHKRIFKDLFTFRNGKGLRTWLDSHNLSSVIALPFHLMITYTGLITLIFMLFPYPALTQFDGNMKAFFEAQNPTRVSTKSTGNIVPIAPPQVWLDQVYTNWLNVRIARVIVDHPFDQHATVKVYANTQNTVQDERPTLLLDAHNGQIIARGNESLSTSETFYDSMTALHTGRLANLPLRWLYFLGGMLGLAMLVTGALMWSLRIKAKHKKPHFGVQLVDTLNLTMIMGLPLATAGFFYANRLLSAQIAQRANVEIAIFFTILGLSLLVSAIRRDKQQWAYFAKLNVFAWAALPICSAIAIKYPTYTAFIEGNTLAWAFDLVFLSVALAFGFVAAKLHRKHSAAFSPQPKVIQR
ncbi:PepSY-associated TM helix domain-containing protein [Pseudoalteromonas xiamenensis]|uniref:PepSY domain-containing protein n=1 Tax=Pseudoalteromonas xiamenensis TaxID=882626 RepID=A0A975HMQ6_9GAMM|nr:PepSY-associated TM helix domain-containing protein [Pseudoalteromonas xiamenensis]QTH73242.1 PepSY domain-containing protein [Pseudoalteromonas xiamenensis]